MIAGFGKLSTAILKYPSGRFGLVGSIPMELTEMGVSTMGLPIRRSKSYNTEEEVINALLEIGITHFQLNNCQWYDNKKV